ncbi:MAG: hypothetical protein M1819_003748 [Sarea resinae]|nr:MAG: hypothetical protein M1819_003748 [Sarea resinae]
MKPRISKAPGSNYFPSPYSLDPLPPDLHRGLIPLGIFALISFLATFGLLLFITWRLISWRKHYRTYLGYNQCVLLIYNLLFADLQQALSLIISFHWLQEDRIVAPTSACFAQGWLIQVGDVSSGLFVLTIALHTFYSVAVGKKMGYIPFCLVVGGIWILTLVLSIIGPTTHKNDYFTRAGAWCWVSQAYEDERLWLHYLWIFISEFGTVVVYAALFLVLRKHMKHVSPHSGSPSSADKVQQAARYMIAYPIVYVLTTLPLAAGRMATMTGADLPNAYYCVAGSLIASCGWIDVLLYTLTRRVLVSGELRQGGGYRRNSTGDGIGAVPNVTFGSSGINKRTRRGGETLITSTRDGSPDGSMEGIMMGVKTETTIEVTSEPASRGRASEEGSDCLGRERSWLA